MLEFLIAVAAGFVTPYLDASVAAPVAKQMEGSLRIEAGELRVLSFIIALLGGGLVIAAIGDLSAFGFALGAGLGYFGTRIVAVLRATIEGRKPDA